MGSIDEAGQPFIGPAVGKKTPGQGASAIVFATRSSLLSGLGGVYLKDNDISPLKVLNDEPKQLTAKCIPAEVAPHSIDPASSERLWTFNERLLEPPRDFRRRQILRDWVHDEEESSTVSG